MLTAVNKEMDDNNFLWASRRGEVYLFTASYFTHKIAYAGNILFLTIETSCEVIDETFDRN